MSFPEPGVLSGGGPEGPLLRALSGPEGPLLRVDSRPEGRAATSASAREFIPQAVDGQDELRVSLPRARLSVSGVTPMKEAIMCWGTR